MLTAFWLLAVGGLEPSSPRGHFSKKPTKTTGSRENRHFCTESKNGLRIYLGEVRHESAQAVLDRWLSLVS